jgi:hypothetical protein
MAGLNPVKPNTPRVMADTFTLADSGPRIEERGNQSMSKSKAKLSEKTKGQIGFKKEKSKAKKITAADAKKIAGGNIYCTIFGPKKS